jgi:hypothetical protein
MHRKDSEKKERLSIGKIDNRIAKTGILIYIF